MKKDGPERAASARRAPTGTRAIKAMADLFDKMVEAEFERLSGIADCSCRSSLDDGFCRILGLPDLGTLLTR